MTSVASSSAATTVAATASTPALDSTDATRDGGASGDLLSGMRPAMDAAFAIGRPTDASGAASILGTGSSYLQGAAATLGKLDEGIAKRRKELEHLKQFDPEAAAEKQSQLDMLQRLRDRIQLSIERVSDILAGKDRDDVGGPDGASNEGDAHGSRDERRLEELALLERRRDLLAPGGADAIAQPANPAAVAGTYASAMTTSTS